MPFVLLQLLLVCVNAADSEITVLFCLFHCHDYQVKAMMADGHARLEGNRFNIRRVKYKALYSFPDRGKVVSSCMQFEETLRKAVCKIEVWG